MGCLINLRFCNTASQQVLLLTVTLGGLPHYLVSQSMFHLLAIAVCIDTNVHVHRSISRTPVLLLSGAVREDEQTRFVCKGTAPILT
jgi:hypothetical protein